MEEMPMGGNMEDKVHVSISEINNGYVFHRSWCEGKGSKSKYHSEEYFMESLPKTLENLFKKGYMKDMAGGGNVWKELEDEPLSEAEEE